MMNDSDNFRDGGFLALHRVRLSLLLLVMALALVDVFPASVRYTVLAAVAVAITWIESGSLRTIGIGQPRSWLATLVGGLVLASITVVVIGQIVAPMLDGVLPSEWRAAPDLWLTGTHPAVPLLGGAVFLVLAISEEVLFRGFLLHHLNALLWDTPPGRLIAVLVGAGLFSVPQVARGVDAILATFLIGLLFGWVFYRSGRNLLLLMLAHALVDAWCMAACVMLPGWLG